jgi:thiol:disulfide interchange protein
MPHIAHFFQFMPRFLIATLLAVAMAVTTPRTLAQPAEPTVQVQVEPSQSAARPGDQIALAVVFEHAEGWHVHTNAPKVPDSWQPFTAIATTIALDAPPAGLLQGAIQWPTPKAIKLDLAATGTPEPYEVFEGTAVAFLPIAIPASATAGSDLVLTLVVRYQACDDTSCQLPKTEKLAVTIPIVAQGQPSQPAADPTRFEKFDRAAFASLGKAQAAPASTGFKENVFGLEISFDAKGAGLLLLLGLALLGGFVLNLTPCVLPVIPIKIMGLSHSAGGKRSRTFMLGVIMTLGVIAFWITISLLMVFVSGFKAVNQLFQIPWFTLGVGAFIAVMGVGMLGLFTFNLPGFVYMVDPKRESPVGSFLFGVMTAVLSTPCTAPFMAGAVAWSTKQPAFVTILTFATIGLGMALPYLVLAAFPQLVSKVPRTGAASELVKQVMGLLMLGVAVFFVGSGLDPLLREPVDDPIRWHWYLVAFAVTTAAAWMIYRAYRIPLKLPTQIVLGVIGLALAAGSFDWARRQNDRGPIRWIGYTPQRFEEARAGGKVIVLDFTAEWCLNCKALEMTVLHRADVVSFINAPGVVAMKVDLSGDNPPGQAKLAELGWTGIPLLATFGPGLPQPTRFDSYTPDMVRGAITSARGGTPSPP